MKFQHQCCTAKDTLLGRTLQFYRNGRLDVGSDPKSFQKGGPQLLMLNLNFLTFLTSFTFEIQFRSSFVFFFSTLQDITKCRPSTEEELCVPCAASPSSRSEDFSSLWNVMIDPISKCLGDSPVSLPLQAEEDLYEGKTYHKLCAITHKKDLAEKDRDRRHVE